MSAALEPTVECDALTPVLVTVGRPFFWTLAVHFPVPYYYSKAGPRRLVLKKTHRQDRESSKTTRSCAKTVRPQPCPVDRRRPSK